MESQTHFGMPRGAKMSLALHEQVVDIISNFYMGHLPMKTNLNANIGYAMSLK
jgi:hypothetical protein